MCRPLAKYAFARHLIGTEERTEHVTVLLLVQFVTRSTSASPSLPGVLVPKHGHSTDVQFAGDSAVSQITHPCASVKRKLFLLETATLHLLDNHQHYIQTTVFLATTTLIRGNDNSNKG